MQAEIQDLIVLLRPRCYLLILYGAENAHVLLPHINRSIITLEARIPGSSIFSVSVWRLKGSVEEFSRCLRMIDLSIMVPDGNLTGSVIRVSMSGSEDTAITLKTTESFTWTQTYRTELILSLQSAILLKLQKIGKSSSKLKWAVDLAPVQIGKNSMKVKS